MGHALKFCSKTFPITKLAEQWKRDEKTALAGQGAVVYVLRRSCR
jgi:hypothetical protein